MNTTSTRVLIIAGMHRSATTLTARWLQACGLYIGERLLVSKFDHANPGGNHFEDLDFLELHRTILRDNKLPADGFVTTETINIVPQRVWQAHQLIANRANCGQWGWKDPRTCLLLDFWRGQLPNANLLVLYRHYTNVVDSMLRRKLNHPSPLRRIFYRLRFASLQSSIKDYLMVWNRYNQDVLSAIQADSDNVLVLNTRDMADLSLEIIQYMNSQWGFQLQPISLQTLMIKDRLKEQSSYVTPDKIRGLGAEVDRAEQTLRELEHWREASLTRLALQDDM